MKKFLSVMLSLVILLSVVIIPSAVNIAAEAATNELEFSEAVEIFSETENNRCIRTKELRDGTVAAVYYKSGNGIYYAVSTDGGITFKNATKLVGNATDSVLAAEEGSSTQVTKAKEYVSNYGENGRGRLEAQNPNLIELDNGNIMVFYRYNTYTSDPVNRPWSRYYSSICYQIFDKENAAWSDVQVMVETNREKALDSTESDYGFWEPDPVYITDPEGNKKLIVYYADTATPNNLSYQHIMGCIYDESTKTFGSPTVMQNGIDHQSRDGMSVVTELKDGGYAMVFESTKTTSTDSTFVIKMSFSNDGLTWGNPVIVAKPEKVLDEPSTEKKEKAVCAAPYVVTLPDGRLAVSYQTTDRYTGRTPEAVSYRVGTQVAISDSAISLDTFEGLATNSDVTASFSNKYNPGVLGENEISKSAELMVKDNQLYVYYSRGKNHWDASDNISHTFGEIDMAHMDVSPSTEKAFSTLDKFVVYQENEVGTPTDVNGKITLPSEGTTNLIAGSGAAEIDYNNPSFTPIEGVFSADNYTEYQNLGKFSFSESDSTITASTASKTMFTSGNFDGVKISSIIEGASTGYIQSGYILNMDSTSLENQKYNSKGYVIFLRRQTSSLQKLELIVRYSVGESSVPSSNYKVKTVKSDLDKTKMDYKYRLTAETNHNNIVITVHLVDNNTETLLGEYSYPLDITTTSETAPVYNSGTFAFVTNGATTYSDVTVKKAEYPISDNRKFNKALDLNAHGVFTLLETPDVMYTGFSFRVKSAKEVTRGIEGYAIKLFQKADAAKLSLELSVYGTKDDGTEYANLKSKAVDISSVLTDSSAGAKMILDVSVVGKTLTATVTNYNDNQKTVTELFDLEEYVKFEEYNTPGGFGIYKHGTGEISVEEISFEILPTSIGTLSESSYTQYAPTEDDKLIFADGKLVSSNSSAKKAILNNTAVNDFKADATFEIGASGDLKSGIIFRAQNVGNETNAMEGYSVTVYKAVSNNDYSRMLILLYKWSRNTNGELCYIGEIDRLVDTTTLKAAYPNSDNSLVASACKKIKLNIEVVGKTVTAYFDALSDDNIVLASSDVASFNLEYDVTTQSGRTKLENATNNYGVDAATTVYNAGQIGLSVSSASKVCGFNLYSDGLTINDTNTSGYRLSSIGDSNIVADGATLSSAVTENKQAVMEDANVGEFDVSAVFTANTFTSFSAGFDFAIGGAYNAEKGTSASTNEGFFYENGFRIQIRQNGKDENANRFQIVLCEFTDYTRSAGVAVQDASFFEGCGTEPVEIALNANLSNGKLSITAYRIDDPTKAVSYECDTIRGVTLASRSSGRFGWYLYNKDSSVRIEKLKTDDIENQRIVAADCTDGFVYSAINSGAATVGQTVKINPIPDKEGEIADVVTVNGQEIPYSENGYVFTKGYTKATISATFGSFSLGDINKNNALEAGDLTLLCRELLEIEYHNIKLTDINGDGEVTLIDIIALKKLIASQG